ncbi:MAG: hypothetical protein ACE5FS_03370 [Paracoccaceae bacterium]
MPTSIIKDDFGRGALFKRLSLMKYPFTVQVKKGRDRTVEQNRTMFFLLSQLAEQSGETMEECRAEMKLAVAVPMMRAEDDDFREFWQKMVVDRSPALGWEQQLSLMTGRYEIPVTRLMTTEQMNRLFDGIIRWAAEGGHYLVMPEDM